MRPDATLAHRRGALHGMTDSIRYFDPAMAPQRAVGHVNETWRASPRQIAHARAKLRRRQQDFAWKRLAPGEVLTLRLDALASDWLEAKLAIPEVGGRRDRVEPALSIAHHAENGIAWAKALPFYGPGAWLVSIEFPDLFPGDWSQAPDDISIMAPARLVLIDDERLPPPGQDYDSMPWEAFWRPGFLGLWLDGTSPFVNTTTSILEQASILDISDRTIEEYLLFFCIHLCADLGAFTLIEFSAEEAEAIEAPMEYGVSDFRMMPDRADALAAMRAHLRPDMHARFKALPVDLATPLILLPHKEEEPFRVIGTVEYSGVFFRSAFTIGTSGGVAMVEDNPIPLVVPRRSGVPWQGPDWLGDGRSVASVVQARDAARARREAAADV